VHETNFSGNQEKFCVHSDAMDKKFFADNQKNTSCLKGADIFCIIDLMSDNLSAYPLRNE